MLKRLICEAMQKDLPACVTNQKMFNGFFFEEEPNVWFSDDNLTLSKAEKMFAGCTTHTSMPDWVYKELRKPQGDCSVSVELAGLVIQDAYDPDRSVTWDGQCWQ